MGRQRKQKSSIYGIEGVCYQQLFIRKEPRSLPSDHFATWRDGNYAGEDEMDAGDVIDD